MPRPKLPAPVVVGGPYSSHGAGNGSREHELAEGHGEGGPCGPRSLRYSSVPVVSGRPGAQSGRCRNGAAQILCRGARRVRNRKPQAQLRGLYP